MTHTHTHKRFAMQGGPAQQVLSNALISKVVAIVSWGLGGREEEGAQISKIAVRSESWRLLLGSSMVFVVSCVVGNFVANVFYKKG